MRWAFEFLRVLRRRNIYITEKGSCSRASARIIGRNLSVRYVVLADSFIDKNLRLQRSCVNMGANLAASLVNGKIWTSTS
ncbi:hypothetical protein KCP74_13475 [Salmonella enterica subsp. enterica]|nr:hypothetical protein KCP74_13475 [Salmonella enterica subsp. enterica]